MARQRTSEKYKTYGTKIGRPRGTSGIKKTVIKENKRVRCNLSLSAEAAAYVSKRAKPVGISKSKIADMAILYYASVYPIDM